MVQHAAMNELALVMLGAAVLLARVGGLLLACGSGRARFAATAAWRSVMEGAIVAVGTGLVSGALVAGGLDLGVEGGTSVLLAGAMLGSAVLVAGAGERTRTRWAAATAAVYGLAVVPLAVAAGSRWLPGGIVEGLGSGLGMMLTAGWVSLVAVVLAGPRAGRFHRDGAISMIPPHQQPMVLAGLGVMMAGWAGGWGILAGEDAATGLEAWLMTPAGALLAGAVFGRWRFGRVDVGLLVPAGVGGALAGALLAMGVGGGLEAVGPWAGVVACGAGAVAGWGSAWVHLVLERWLQADDLTGAVAGQVTGPVVGAVVVGGMSGGAGLFTAVFAVVVYMAIAVMLAAVVLGVLRAVTEVRIDEATEYEGLDLAGLDLNAYPDFQQPMIRSSHLREV